MPKVSIGIPVRNGEQFLPYAIDAIRGQTFRDFEVLISDNASIDATARIAQAVCRQDSRFRYHRQHENVGASSNFNFVFANTVGLYFKWAAHDDTIRTDYLAKCVSALDASPPDVVLVYPQTMNIDASGRELGRYQAVTHTGGITPSERLAALIGPGDETRSLLHMCYSIFGLMRRSALQGTSLIANMPRSDNLLLVELALKGHFVEVDDDLFLRRAHDDGSVIAAERAGHGPEVERILASWFDPRRGVRFPATTTRLALGYMRAILRTQMPLEEKVRCLRIAAEWTARRARVIGGEIKILLRERLPRPRRTA